MISIMVNMVYYTHLRISQVKLIIYVARYLTNVYQLYISRQ